LVQGLPAEVGIDPGLVHLKFLAANALQDFLDTVTQFLECLQGLEKAA